MQFMFKGKKRDGYLWLSILVLVVFFTYVTWVKPTVMLILGTLIILLVATGYVANVVIDRLMDKW